MPKLLVAFGLYALSDTVTKPIFDLLRQKITEQFANGMGQYMYLLDVLGVNDAINIVFAAYIMAISLKAVKSGVAK